MPRPQYRKRKPIAEVLVAALLTHVNNNDVIRDTISDMTELPPKMD